MKTYLEKILPHPENPELSVIFKAVEDDVDPSTLSDSYMEESVSDEIQLKFFSGNKAAWFTAHVKVCNKGDEENLEHGFGEDFLGGCNYHTFEDFLGSEQFKDMVKNATNELVKGQEATASTPMWHADDQGNEIYGTQEQVDVWAHISDGVICQLPMIYGGVGYNGGSDEPNFELANFADLAESYEDRLQAMRETLEESYNSAVYVEGNLVEAEEIAKAATPVMTVKDLTDGLGTNDDDCAMIIQNDGTGDSYPVCKVKTINGYTTIIANNCVPKDAYDYLGFLQTLGHFNDSSEIVVLIDNPVAQGEFLITSIEELDKKIILHVEDSRSLAKVQASETVSWEEILPEVWVYGTSKQVECAIQDGDLPLEIPCIAHDKGFEPLSENADYSLEDFLVGFEQNVDESKMAQMRAALEKSYKPDAYSNMVEHETVEANEEMEDFNSCNADVNKKFTLLTNEDATGKNLKANFLKNLTKNLNDYHKLYGQEALEQSLEKLCLDFASNNGVTFEDKGDTLLFIQKGLEDYAKQPKIDEAISGKKTVASDKCLTHSFSDVEIEDANGEPQIYEVEVEQCFDFEHGYGADADGNRGQNTWFFSDMSVLSIQDEHGKHIDLKTKEGMELKNKIESDKWFTKTVENHDWDVAEGWTKASRSKLPS